MKLIAFLGLFLLAAGPYIIRADDEGPQKRKIKVLIVTGGHDYDREPFYQAFDAIPSITYDTIVHPEANSLIASPTVNQYDVLIFYDMGEKISAEQKQAYINLLNKGKSMIFLHHSLVSYQDWPEFLKIVGGQYHTHPVVVNGDTLSANYQHDVTIPVKVERRDHPIVRGIKDFEIFDEIYMDAEISPTVQPLLSTTHPKSMRYLAWVNKYGNSDVVYIQLGHGETGLSNPNFRKILQQAIEWSADRHTVKASRVN
jgi:type 1 glutamine amidotransferase